MPPAPLPTAFLSSSDFPMATPHMFTNQVPPSPSDADSKVQGKERRQLISSPFPLPCCRGCMQGEGHLTPKNLRIPLAEIHLFPRNIHQNSFCSEKSRTLFRMSECSSMQGKGRGGKKSRFYTVPFGKENFLV